jgi:hypothetical protein
MDKKRIISRITLVALLSLFIGGIAKAQYYNLTTYYPISSDPYIQSLNNGVMQNTAYTLGQYSNFAVLFPTILEIIVVILFLWVIVRAFAPFFNK